MSKHFKANAIPGLTGFMFLCATSLAFSQQLNVLVIGSTRSFSEGGESGVAHEKPFNPAGIATHLQGILSQDPAITDTVNVEFEDIYKTKAQTVNYSGTTVYNFTSRCYSLAQHYLWPDGKAARLANLRGEGTRVWDYIVLCNDPYIMANFPGMVAEGVKLIKDEVAKSANPAQVVVLAQWPHSGSTFTANQFNEIAHRVGNSASLTVVPAGKAWDSYGSKDTSSSHPTPRGEYLAAASIYSKLFNRSAKTSAYDYPAVGDAIADHALSVIQANAGVAQYSGTYTSFNPFQMKYLTKRVVSYRETGTSTEDRIAQALDRLDDVQRITFNTTGYAGAPGTRWDFNYGRGNDWWEPDKQYEVDPNKYDWVYGFPMHHYSTTSAPVTMPYGIDKHYCNGYNATEWIYNDYEDGTDLGIAYNMVRPGTREPDWPEAVRAIPIRLMWQKMCEVSPGFNPLGDSTHMNPNLNDASAAFMYTLLSGRCPVVVEPAPQGSANPAWMQWLGHKTGYETAWQMSHLTTRTPGFRVLPSSTAATTVTPTTTETMTVQFMYPPQSDVTVTVSISSPTAAIVGPKTLTFTPSNYNTPQQVTVAGIPGAAASPSFEVAFTTTSNDEIYHGLTDSWAYTNTRGATAGLTQVNNGTTAAYTTQATPVSINLNAAGANSGNTILIGPLRGAVSWTGSGVIQYTPNVGYLGPDEITYAATVGGTQTIGTIAINVGVLEGQVNVSTGDAAASEQGPDTGTFLISRAGSTSSALNVFFTLGGSATPGSDYSLSHASPVTIPSGQSSVTLTLTPVDDSVFGEGQETATLTVTADPAYPIGNASSSIIITDNDNYAPVVNAGADQNVTISGGASWSPALTTTRLWLDADDATTMTLNGAAVSEWRDKSGNNRHASQTTAGSQPTRTAAALNGKSVLTFDGTTDYFDLGTGLDFLAGVSHSAFVVTKPTAFNNIYGAATSNAGANSLHVGFNGGNYRMNYWSNDYGPARTANYVTGSANIVNYIWTSGTSKEILANGKSEGTLASAGVIGAMSGGGRIGNIVGQGYIGGDIAEIVFLTGTVAQADRETMEGYLAHKWGLTANLASAHPYKNIAPGGSAAIASLDATVTDADGQTPSALWTRISGPGPVTFATATAVDTTATFSVAGTYVLRLTADDGFAQVSDDVVITVNPAVASLAVTYSGNGSTGGSVPTDASSPYTNGSTVTVLGNTGSLVRTGYTFNNWNTAADGSGTTYAPGNTFTIGAATTLYAQWTTTAYAVSYNGNGNTGGAAPTSQSKIQGINLTLSGAGTLVRSGYTFSHWNTAANGSGTSYAAGATYSVDAALALYAQWTAAPTYTISFSGNGNTSGSAPADQTKTQGVDLVLSGAGTLARTGYTFSGWNTAANGSGTAYAAGAAYTIDAAQTFYAQWTINTYTVTYDGNGSTSGSVSNQTKTHDVDLVLANAGTLIRTGHVFTGWNTAADGMGADYPAATTYSTNAPLALYAKWDRLPTVFALNPGNGATGVSSSGDLTITFSENVAFGTGAITLRQSGGTLVESFNVASPPSGLTLSGATVTLNPATNLIPATTYYVEIDASAIDDLAGNSFAGFSGNGNWSFTILPQTLADSYLTSLDVSTPLTLLPAGNFPSYVAGDMTDSSTLTITGGFTQDSPSLGTVSLINNNSSFSGSFVVNSGVLRIAGSPFASNGGFTAANMNSGDTITINRHGTFTIDDYNNNVASGYTANRFGTGASSNRPAVNLAGGTINLNGLNNASSSVQTFGALTSSSGQGTLNVTRNSNGNPTLTFDSLTISSGSLLTFNGTALGTGTSDARITFTSTPTLTSGILAGARFYSGAAGTSEFVTYGANGVRSFTTSDYTVYGAMDINAATETQNVQMTGAVAPVVLAGNVTVNSLNYNGNAGTWSLGGNTLTIASGMFLRNGTNTSPSITTGTLTAGTGSPINLHIIVAQHTGPFISAVIANNGASGVVTLVKSGDGRGLTLNNDTANNTYTGGTSVVGGDLITGTTASRRYLGTGKVTVDGNSSLQLGNYGATSNSTGDDYTAINGGRIQVSNNNHGGNGDTFNIGANSIINGVSSSAGNGLNSLTRGTNITLASGAVIAHNTGLAAALNLGTGTIQSLGTSADVFYGLAGNQSNSAGAITIGNGTGFRGISTDRASDREWQLGTINIASGTTSVDFQGLGPQLTSTSVYQLTLGNGATAGGPVIAFAGTGTVNINAIGRITLNDDAAVYGNTGASQNIRFVATPSSIFTVTPAAGMGSGTGIASALIQNGGTLVIGNAAALNGAVTVEAGGQIRASQAGGLTGTPGVLAFKEGSILNVTHATGFSGSQATAATINPGTLVKLNVANWGGTSDTTTLDSILGSGLKSVSYIHAGVDAANPTSGTLPTAVYTLNKSSGGKGGVLTNESATARNVGALTNGNITLGANGGVIAATTNSTFTISENITGAGSLTIGTTAIIDGMPKLGIVSLNATTNDYTGGTIVNAGTLTMGAAYTVLGSATGTLTVNGGTMNMAGNSLTVGNLTGTGGVISGTSGTRTLTIGQGDFGGGNFQGVIANGSVGTTALTKTGGGTITLSGTNTYTGATAINAGTLFINGDQSSAAGNVTVAANATLGGIGTLGGNTTIDSGGKLEFNLSTPAGSHNPLDLIEGKIFTFSGASTLTITSSGGASPGLYTLVTARGGITGSAPATLNLPSGWVATVYKSVDNKNLLLDVTSTGGNTFANWINGFSGLGGPTGFNDDADRDGIRNGMEAFFGTAPNATNAGLSAVARSGNTLTFTHPEADPPLTDVYGSYEWSLDLANWNASGVAASGTTVTITAARNSPTVGTTTVTATITGTVAGKIFVRAKATLN